LILIVVLRDFFALHYIVKGASGFMDPAHGGWTPEWPKGNMINVGIAISLRKDTRPKRMRPPHAMRRECEDIGQCTERTNVFEIKCSGVFGVHWLGGKKGKPREVDFHGKVYCCPEKKSENVEVLLK
jgi:hypothetical protein